MFYTKIVKTETIIEKLDTLQLSAEEKLHLSGLIDTSLHHVILNEVLSNLSTEDKKEFLKLSAHESNHSKILEFLTQKIEDIEEKITKVSDQLISEMHKDIEEAREVEQ